MTNRFSGEKKPHDRWRMLFTVCLSAAVLLAFWYGVSAVSTRTEEEELATLEKALNRQITYCYAVEGHYPDSLDSLKKDYGLTYNEEKYMISYHSLGANIMPDVTIIRKKEH